jgi:hypothetical protein
MIRNDDYKLDIDQYQIYLDTLKKRLRAILYVWPPHEHLEIGSKDQLMKNLDLVAKIRTNTDRPKWRILKDGDRLSHDLIIKRTHSDCGSHVLKPGNILRDWEYLRNETIPGSVWIAQTYVPHLCELGEWRVIIVGGEIIYIVHTDYDEDGDVWSWEPVRTYYSLKELE